MNKLLLFFLSCCLFISYTTQAQSVVEKEENLEVEITYAIKLGHTLPIRDLVPTPTADAEKRKKVKANKKDAPANFANKRAYKKVNPNALPLLEQTDALWQKGFNNQSNNKAPSISIEPLVNINGLSNGSSPHDPSGDIGREYYLQAINSTELGVYTKQGQLVQEFTANTIWNSIGFSSAGDPIILYDQEYDRWLITEFPNGNQLLVAISDSSDPLGGWTAYNFATPLFPDYPKYGIWSNAYTVTTNEGATGTQPIYFIDREAMLNGNDEVSIIRTTVSEYPAGMGFQVATPVDWSGNTAPEKDEPIFLTLGDDAWQNGANVQDRIRIHEYQVDFSANFASRTTTTIFPSAFDTDGCSVFTGGFSCVPQNGNGGGLDAIPEIITYQPHYRNFGTHESIVLNFMVDVTAGQNLAGIRWIELRRTNNADWEIYQEGTFAPDDGKDRFLGAICMDGYGNIALGYAITSPDDYVSLAFTGRTASDPLGEMTVEEYVLVEGTNTINSGSRFGDYFHMSIDPTNNRTFWFTAEYAGGGTGNSRTRIAAFELGRDTLDLAPTALLSPATAGDLTENELVSLEITNLGLEPQIGFRVGYIFDNQEAIISDPIGEFLQANDTYTHTFSNTVDMSEIGDYEFKIFTQSASDTAPINDTLRVIVSQLPRFDASITNIQFNETVCGSATSEATLIITNLGTETLNNANVVVMANGIVQDEFFWIGVLEAGESADIEVVLTDLLDGENTVIATTNLPNGEEDERTQNNSFITTVESNQTGQAVIFEISTDQYPSETTWQLADENGEILYTGGPYSSQDTFTDEWCLAVEKCFEFTLFDSYGDGILGNNGYTIATESGDVLFAGNGNFSTIQTNNFCTEYQCLMTIEVDMQQASQTGEADGSLMITPVNGVGPYEYSIDGGQTFQATNLFTGLTAGSYQIVVNDDFSCSSFNATLVTNCTLTTSISVSNETYPDADDGTITIISVGGTAPYLYSINGGDTFSSNNSFADLSDAVYEVVVQDANGCQRTETLEVMELNTSNDLIDVYGQTIQVMPNPTNNIVSIHLDGYNGTEVMLDFDVFDIAGKRIQSGKLVKYNQTYKGQISFVVYPSGVYFVRFWNKDISELVKIVKN